MHDGIVVIDPMIGHGIPIIKGTRVPVDTILESTIMHEKIDRAVQKIKSLGGDKIRFIILYGSASIGRMKEDSDIDISVYYDDSDAYEFLLKVLSELFDDVYDIKIFQQLPHPLRMQVLKSKVLYEDDTPFMCDNAYETIKEFESFSADTTITWE